MQDKYTPAATSKRFTELLAIRQVHAPAMSRMDELRSYLITACNLLTSGCSAVYRHRPIHVLFLDGLR